MLFTRNIDNVIANLKEAEELLSGKGQKRGRNIKKLEEARHKSEYVLRKIIPIDHHRLHLLIVRIARHIHMTKGNHWDKFDREDDDIKQLIRLAKKIKQEELREAKII